MLPKLVGSHIAQAAALFPSHPSLPRAGLVALSAKIKVSSSADFAWLWAQWMLGTILLWALKLPFPLTTAGAQSYVSPTLQWTEE